MFLQRVNPKFFRKGFKWRRYYATSLKADEEYTATPQYPEILDTSHEKIVERRNARLHDEIKKIKTVEEKQIKINMPKYYGFKCYILKEDVVPYNNLQLTQHITRTHLIESNTLPTYYDTINVDNVVESIKSEIEELLLMEYNGYMKMRDIKQDITPLEKENVLSSSISRQLNRLLLIALSGSNPHLENMHVDFDPRIESFWYAGGMNPPENIKRCRKGVPWRKDTENVPVNRAIQSFDMPCVALRAEQPLNPLIAYSEVENNDFHVPFFQYDPRVVGTTTEHRHAVNTPGYWPGESHQFGTLSYHRRGHMLERNFGDEAENKEALHRQGILSSFSWLNAQANMLGFTTFNDITYPLVTQTCITNGQLWSFYVYQLNTMLVHSKHVNDNPKKNICWATPELKLFDSITNDKIENLNLDVLKMILKFYLNKPEKRVGENLRPYLSSDENFIADYADEDKRTWLEREYKYLVSNRPRLKLFYELYHWEKIYKVDHKTRIMDKRRRPFELFIKPSNRTLDDRQARYIPKVLRPDLPKTKGRYAKEYFP